MQKKIVKEGGIVMTEFDVKEFAIEEVETVEAPGEEAFWVGVGVGVVIGIALC